MKPELCNICEMRPNNKECLAEKIVAEDKYFVTPLNNSSEIMIQTNLENQIKILGIAKATIRDKRGDPPRKGYLVLYSRYEIKEKAEISKELYEALSLVFSAVNPNNMFVDYEIEG